ncbi:MAG: hypothetical protein LBL36_00075 [Clostridiales Family XIII bacterium]|jgi:hypothetical protein|nr:hypothetical protein [Clostridiales Family XIII bacterium]
MIYSDCSGLILGFHGCSKDVYGAVIRDSKPLSPSTNSYDWLGSGIYFWENSYMRANDWAINRFGEENAAVIGAVIDLSSCFDLTDYSNTEYVREAYNSLVVDIKNNGKEMPRNKNVNNNDDWLMRELDCAVINQVHLLNKKLKRKQFDSLRGMFAEGRSIYKGAGFREKTHTQLCIRNLHCIKGYFTPLDDKGNALITVD